MRDGEARTKDDTPRPRTGAPQAKGGAPRANEPAIRMRGAVPPPPADDWPGPLDLAIGEGEFRVLIAPPTAAMAFIRLCVGLRAPASGTVEVLGVRPGELDRWRAQAFRRRLGVGFAEPSGLISNLTIRSNLIVPLLYSGAAELAEATARAAETIEACGISRWADVRPAELPPAARRRAVVARAVAREPELLLLEEPVGSSRDAGAAALLALCRERARTVVVLTAAAEGPALDMATLTTSLDEFGIEVPDHEVGTR